MTKPVARPSTEPPDISTERQRVLLTIATAVSRSLDPQEVAETALWLAIEAVDLKVGMVLLLEDPQPIILASHGFPLGWLHEFQTAVQHLEWTIIGDILKADEPKVFSDLQLVPADAVVQLFQRVPLQTLAGVPLRAPGDVYGILIIGGPQERALKIPDVELLEAIASQISAGLRNAWLFSQSWRQLEELESVADAAHAVVSSLDSDEILTRIIGAATDQLDSEEAALLLLDPVKQELEFVALADPQSAGLRGTRLRVGQGIAGWVAQHSQSLLVPDTVQDPRFFSDIDTKTGTATRSILCVPLLVRERLIGVLEVLNKRHGQFSNSDRRYLEALATFAAIAIENARLFDEAKRQTQQATLYAKDLSVAYQRERKQREALDGLRYSFLNVVGHELKTPLTVIQQGLEVLRDPKRGPLNTEQTEMVTVLGRNLNYLGRVIDGLITFAAFSARQGTMKFQEVPFETVLDDALMLSEFKASRKSITLEDRRQVNLPILSLDKERLSEAIAHLIDNAIKFSAEGSTVVVESGSQDSELVVRVIDEGQGISADQLDSIWDSFVQMSTTLERGLEGLGLGLAIARYIIEAHNGAITVQSQEGKGSAFTIRLPVG